MNFWKLALVCVPFFVWPITLQAQWEVESDPTAYALKGFSAHVGHTVFNGRMRWQIGAFGAETPEWIHGNKGFTENSRGGTIKIDYFPLRPLRGLFFGADSNYSRVRYALEDTHERAYGNIVGIGPRVGYRFGLGKHLYLNPWVSTDYQFNAKDVSISGKIFHEKKYSIFPAIHVGWKF
jgi:Protein of unknown function (DUF3575)